MPDPAPRPAAPARTFPDGVPTLVDPATGVTLRATSAADLPAMVEQSRDPETIRWTTSVPTPPGGYSIRDAEEFFTRIRTGWTEGRHLSWTVEAERDGVRQACGQVGIRMEDPGWAEIGFALHPGARRRSVMSTAVRLVRDYAFDVVGLSMLRWRAIAGNWGSRNVAAAAGFAFDGTVRRLLNQRGTLRDGWLATMTREDSRTPRRGLVPVELLGPGLVLRPFTDTDADRVVEACSDPRTQHWLISLPRTYTVTDALSYLEHTRELAGRGTGLVWCIADAEDDRCLGSIGLEGLGSYAPRAEIGYWAHPEARGKGTVTQAVRLVTGYARSAGLASSIVIRCAEGNTASRYAAEAAGYREVGRMPEAEPVGRGELSVLVLYAMP
jgi:[ribosomal protein S5]-alanine N-acetyltransferase